MGPESGTQGCAMTTTVASWYGLMICRNIGAQLYGISGVIDMKNTATILQPTTARALEREEEGGSVGGVAWGNQEGRTVA